MTQTLLERSMSKLRAMQAVKVPGVLIHICMTFKYARHINIFTGYFYHRYFQNISKGGS